MGITSGRDRMKDHLSVRPSLLSESPVPVSPSRAQHALIRTVAYVKDVMSTFR